MHAFAGDLPNAPLAVVSSQVVQPTSSWGAITLCGASGVGKSMLLQGFTSNFQTAHPRAAVYFRDAVDFAREFADALETNTLDEFRSRTRNVSFFALDDLHQIDHKRPVQEELCRTLDMLTSTAAHIIVAVSAPWNQAKLIPNLQSRLEGGLIVPIHPPSPETRRRLLEQCAERAGLRLPAALIQWLLESVLLDGATYREIQHCVHQLHQIAQPGGAVTLLAAQDLLDATNGRVVTVNSIQIAVARAFQCRKKDLTGPSRQQGISLARSVAMYLCRELTELSYKVIGQRFGKRDHSTVMHACHKTVERLAEDDTFAATVHQLLESLSPHPGRKA